MGKRKYTEIQDEWLKTNVKKYKRYKDLAEAFNHEFNETRTCYGVQSRIRNLDITLTPINKTYTKEQNEWLLENVHNYESYDLLTKQFNKIFNDDRTWKSICAHLNYIGFGKKSYKKEEIEWLMNNYNKFPDYKTLTDNYNNVFENKRTTIAIQCCCNKLGIKFRNKKAKPIGNESIKKDGTVLVKVESNDVNQQYIPKARYVWEQINGKIPNGYTIIHLDNNKSNNNIDNLMCVPKRVQQTISRLMSENPEVTITAIKIGELLVAIKN